MKWLPGLRALAVAAVLALPLLAAFGYWGLGQAGERLPVYWDAPAFTLTDQLERPVSSDELRGKVVVANFIYTSCRDICPLLSFKMQQLQERLRQENWLGGQVQLLSFTVDPDRDTPAVLKEYAERHKADPQAWRFLSGPKEQLLPLITDGFKLSVVPPATEADQGDIAGGEGDASDQVMHSGRFVLIDRHWQVRANYDGRELDPDQVVRDIRQFLR